MFLWRYYRLLKLWSVLFLSFKFTLIFVVHFFKILLRAVYDVKSVFTYVQIRKDNMFVNNKGKPYASLDTNRYWKFRLTGEYGLKASDNTINIFLRVLYIRNKPRLVKTE